MSLGVFTEVVSDFQAQRLGPPCSMLSGSPQEWVPPRFSLHGEGQGDPTDRAQEVHSSGTAAKPSWPGLLLTFTSCRAEKCPQQRVLLHVIQIGYQPAQTKSTVQPRQTPVPSPELKGELLCFVNFESQDVLNG